MDLDSFGGALPAFVQGLAASKAAGQGGDRNDEVTGLVRLHDDGASTHEVHPPIVRRTIYELTARAARSGRGGSWTCCATRATSIRSFQPRFPSRWDSLPTNSPTSWQYVSSPSRNSSANSTANCMPH